MTRVQRLRAAIDPDSVIAADDQLGAVLRMIYGLQPAPPTCACGCIAVAGRWCANCGQPIAKRTAA